MRVWIETIGVNRLSKKHIVTLYVRVWIETPLLFIITISPNRHPLREGVDWNICKPKPTLDDYVTLYVRVWIETLNLGEFKTLISSPSTWGCGLKPCWIPVPCGKCVSPSTWGCGLKLLIDAQKRKIKRSPSTWGCGLKPYSNLW